MSLITITCNLLLYEGRSINYKTAPIHQFLK